MKRFQLAAGALFLLAAAGGAVWFFAFEPRRPGLVGTVRLATRIAGVAVCAALGASFLRNGLVAAPAKRRPAEDDEEAGW